MEDLLRKTGYSDKAIEYYLKKLHVGNIKDPSVVFSYTGPCGDTFKIYLSIDAGIIKEATFEAIGCAGAFSAASALIEMITGKNINQVNNIKEEDIIDHLGGVPVTKMDCVHLAKVTFEKTLQQYRSKGKD